MAKRTTTRKAPAAAKAEAPATAAPANKTTAAAAKSPARPAGVHARRADAAAPGNAKAAESGEATTTIKIEKGGTSGRRGFVDVGVNGQISRLKVGEEIPVNEGVLNALSDSGVTFSTIKPLDGAAAGEGSPAADSTIGGTAFRGEEEPPKSVKPDGEPAELRQVTDDDLKTSSQNAGAAAAGEEANKAPTKEPAA